MKISQYFLFVLSILLLNLGTLNAATLLGKVAIYTPSSGTDTGIETYPLVSGNKMSFDHKALIKIAGGTLLADEGTVLTAFDKGGLITFRVEKGGIYFRLLPSKQRISLKVLQGEISSPKIATASDSIVAGRIVATDRNTMVEVSEGSLDISTSKGLTRVNAGQKINLAQAKVEEAPPAEGVTVSGASEGVSTAPLLIGLGAAATVIVGGVTLGVATQGGHEASSIK